MRSHFCGRIGVGKSMTDFPLRIWRDSHWGHDLVFLLAAWSNARKQTRNRTISWILEDSVKIDLQSSFKSTIPMIWVTWRFGNFFWELRCSKPRSQPGHMHIQAPPPHMQTAACSCGLKEFIMNHEPQFPGPTKFCQAPHASFSSRTTQRFLSSSLGPIGILWLVQWHCTT